MNVPLKMSFAKLISQANDLINETKYMGEKNNGLLESAKKYLEKGWGVVPVNFSKATIEDGEVKKQFKFLPAYQEYHSKKVLPEQIEAMWDGYNGIAIITGRVSGISVVDVDWKDLPEIKDLPKTFTVETHKGYHFYFNYTEASKTMSGVLKDGDKEFNVDQRNNGGLVFADPSKYELPDGSIAKYKVIKDVPLADFPVQWLKDVHKKYKPEVVVNEKKWLKGKDGVVKGSRNDTAASMAGKIIYSTAPELWETLGWEQLQIWNTKNPKPLTINELRTVWESIKREHNDETQEDNKPQSQANILLETIIGRQDVTLFHDEQSDGYIALDISGHREIRACRSKAIRKWLSSELYRTQKKAPSSEVIKSILSVLEGKACFDGEEIELQNRVAWHNGELWYDLTNKEWQAIRINKDGWGVIDKPPIIFKRYSHHKAQIMPDKNGDAKLFLNYVNVKNPEHQLLLLVFLISCFIPGFPHVMSVIFGPQGSSKSTQSKLARLLVDPSMIDVASFPGSQRELIQALAHHYFLFFDNVSYISEEQSDALCRAVTGGGHVKRELYENDEDIIYNFMRCIGLNGINLVTTRPDLLERSLLLELERIDPKERKTEKELYENFRKDLPAILGGVFDTLVKAINIQPIIKLDSHHRMADWALWGCIIAEALGYNREAFISAYDNNIVRQTEMLLNENIVATAIFAFMEGKDHWRDTPTQLLTGLSMQASFWGIDTREKFWPKGANILSRRLNELSTPLKQMGLLVNISTTGAERYVEIQRITKETAPQINSADEITNPLPADGTDDMSEASTKKEGINQTN